MQLTQFSSTLSLALLSLLNNIHQASSLPTMDANTYLHPSITSRQSYTPGWCGMHVTQYQKPNPATDHYRLDIRLFDGAGRLIGEVDGADAPAGQGVGVTSQLPWVFIATTGNVDADAVLFDYADQHWGSNDQQHQCRFGAYDSGSRNGDCGFSC